jgi:hypothetical protein
MPYRSAVGATPSPTDRRIAVFFDLQLRAPDRAAGKTILASMQSASCSRSSAVFNRASQIAGLPARSANSRYQTARLRNSSGFLMELSRGWLSKPVCLPAATRKLNQAVFGRAKWDSARRRGRVTGCHHDAVGLSGVIALRAHYGTAVAVLDDESDRELECFGLLPNSSGTVSPIASRFGKATWW